MLSMGRHQTESLMCTKDQRPMPSEGSTGTLMSCQHHTYYSTTVLQLYNVSLKCWQPAQGLL